MCVLLRPLLSEKSSDFLTCKSHVLFTKNLLTCYKCKCRETWRKIIHKLTAQLSFKIPRFKAKPPDSVIFSGLRRFLLDEVTDRIDIGVGSYGLVKFGRYSTDGKQSRDVVNKIAGDFTGYEEEFAKEAKARVKRRTSHEPNSIKLIYMN